MNNRFEFVAITVWDALRSAPRGPASGEFVGKDRLPDGRVRIDQFPRLSFVGDCQYERCAGAIAERTGQTKVSLPVKTGEAVPVFRGG